MDFGLARVVDDASLTRSGTLAGTPQYMSPEQARAETVDHRSDLFSLGSVMYAMCIGHAPFRELYYQETKRNEAGQGTENPAKSVPAESDSTSSSKEAFKVH